ncbi:hypothetical protein MMC30_004716 [Trapelia coarctata]|nr:hypothetical protein [Trapelia coarctata]
MAAASPPERKTFRIGALTGFLPLSDDLVSTRGQKLPGLIQSWSTTNLNDSSKSRKGSIRGHAAYEGTDDEESVHERWSGEEPNRPLARLMSVSAEVLNSPKVRSMRLIGQNNPRYQWEQYYKTEEELKKMKKPIRQYYEKNNRLIAQYMYIDRLLNSSLPHSLIQEYNPDVPPTINEEPEGTANDTNTPPDGVSRQSTKLKRTPKNLYRLPNEEAPLLGNGDADGEGASKYQIEMPEDDSEDSQSPIVTLAIYINLAANFILLCGKIVVIVLTSSLSVLASLVDAALDFLSTAIVWVTTRLISVQDQHKYPVGRRRLEPIGVLVFSVVMITAFCQVALQCFQRLTSGDRSVVELTVPSIIIMALTVVIKFACWLWCRLVNNSSVQALAQDAMTDVVFNIFSIIFPLVGFYTKTWYLDALGGLLLSLFVIVNWSRTSRTHILHLTGSSAAPEQTSLLLYLTMRFAQPIRHIQSLQAYYAGDKLNVEVDVVLDERMRLRDSHDLGESLQYVLESVPSVERAWVHLDYRRDNLPGHLRQDEEGD